MYIATYTFTDVISTLNYSPQDGVVSVLSISITSF